MTLVCSSTKMIALTKNQYKKISTSQMVTGDKSEEILKRKLLKKKKVLKMSPPKMMVCLVMKTMKALHLYKTCLYALEKGAFLLKC